MSDPKCQIVTMRRFPNGDIMVTFKDEQVNSIVNHTIPSRYMNMEYLMKDIMVFLSIN